MTEQRKQLRDLAHKIVADHPEGEAADFGVLLNRLIRKSPPGVKIHALRAVLQNIIAGA